MFEPAATMVTAAAAEIPAGLYGLLEYDRTFDADRGAEAVRELQDRYTYIPRSQQGMENLQKVGSYMERAMNSPKFGQWVAGVPGMLAGYEGFSVNDAIAAFRDQAGRLGAGPAAIAEGALAAIPPIPARAGRLARAADDFGDKVYYHGSDAPWWSDPDFDVAYSGKGYGPEGQFGIERTSEEFGPLSFSLAKDRATAEGYGPHVGEFRIRGEVYPDFYDATEKARAAGVDVDQWVMDQGYVGAYLDEFDDVRIYNASAVVPVADNGSKPSFQGRFDEGRLTAYQPEPQGLLADQPLLDLPDPRTATGPMKATLGKALAPLSRPGVRSRERLRQGGETVIDETQRAQGRLLDPESLLGNVLVPVAGDRTRAGGRLQQVRGVPLRGALELEGGPGFAEQHAGTGAAWASMKPAAASKQANITKAAEATGAKPVGVYTSMSPEGSNFSHHVAEGMLRQVPSLDISKGAKKRFDDFVRNKAVPSQRIPDWVGIDSESALDQVLGRGEFPMEGSGDLRKRLVNAMSSAQFRDVGFPSYVDTLEAVNDPRLAGQGVGSSGLVMFEGRPGAPLIRETGHSSYSHDIPGEYIGGLEQSVPLDVMFPKTVGRLMEEGKTNIPRSFQMSHQWELADEEWLEGIMRYLQANQRTQ